MALLVPPPLPTLAPASRIGLPWLDAFDARPEIYEAQIQVFEPVTELPPHEHLLLDCGRPPGQSVLKARRLVEERLAPPTRGPPILGFQGYSRKRIEVLSDLL